MTKEINIPQENKRVDTQLGLSSEIAAISNGFNAKVSDILADSYIRRYEKVALTNNDITFVGGEIKKVFGREVANVAVNNDKEMLIDPKTKERVILKIKGTDNIINHIRSNTLPGEKGETIIEADFDGGWVLANSDTLEQVEITIKGTDDKIVQIGKRSKIWGEEVQEVVTDKGNWVIINPNTKERIILKIVGIEGEITNIGINYTVGEHELQQVTISDKTTIIVNILTGEVVKIYDKVVIRIEVVHRNEYIFTTDDGHKYLVSA